jgi:sporulation protein YlmC with PRC-barrel domain
MAHYGTLRDFRFSDTDAAKDDIRGSHVYGRDDEKLGKIDDVIFDHASGEIRYVVIDTGGWLHSKKFVVPPDRLHSSAKHEDDFQVDLSKEQIESFPPYDEDSVKDEQKWGDYERKYRSKWETGPVMHRAETDRNITPTTAQMTQGTGATGPMTGAPAGGGQQDVNYRGGTSAGPAPGFHSGTSTASGPTSDAGVNRSVTPARTDTTLDIESMGPGRRWTRFEDKLRQRRSDIISGCSVCGRQPSSEHLGERERKVS